MNKHNRILILGSRGLVGSALVRQLNSSGYLNLLTPTREELDLSKQKECIEYFLSHKPEYVFLAAAKVGGIHANNTYPADFIFENIRIQSNVFEAAFISNVDKLLFLGSSCIYPKHSAQPIKEEYLLTGPLEPTNEPYAIAKIAGLKTAEYFRKQYGRKFFSVMPTNLYGVNDNFDLQNSHVIPGLIARMKEAIDSEKSTFEVWGTGTPRREFLYVDDMADACIFLMKLEEIPFNLINIGYGDDISIKEVANLVKKSLGFKGEITFNTSFPDGTPRKLLDSSRLLSLGWKPKVALEEGIKKSVDFYLSL